MGACTSSKEKKQVVVLDTFDQQPQDTEGMRDITLPKLIFSAQLTKIKIKRCIYPSISMKFSISGVQQFMLPPKDVTSQIAKWDVQHIFRFQMTQYQMRKKFLIITFFDRTNIQVGNLKINLYLLATGPFHLDFAINLKDDPAARVSFNLKIAQIIKMKFEFLQSEMKPYEKQYPGDKFTFSVRSIMGSVTQYTHQSYVISVAFDQQQYQKQKISKQQRGQPTSPTKEKRLKSKKSIMANLQGHQIQVDKNHLLWSKQKSQQMPSFSTEIALYDMHSSAFHIIYWKVSNPNQNQEDNIKSQCFVSINKLLNFQSKVVFDENIVPFQQRLIDLQQKNWSHGKQVGTSHVRMIFKIQKHIKQMNVCVRTQQGILKSSPVFSRQQTKAAVNKEINILMQLTARIDSQFIELAKVRKSNGSTLQVRRNIENIIKLMNQQKQLLQTSVKQSTMFFNYKDQKQLLKSQEQLIQIAFKTKTYINQNIEQISSTCFALLSTLMRRGQLSLAHLGFNYQSNSSSTQDISPNSFKSKKIVIALRYQQLLNQLMELTLFSLNFKGHQSQKQFAQLFCAVAYFRIPPFRSHVLRSICRNDDPQIQQWRGTEFNLYDKGDSKLLLTAGQQKNTYQILFDWENNFYKYIQGQENYKKNIADLESILQQNQWQERIKKRRGAFFSFVQYWCDYVETIAVNSKNLKWKHFPGYNRILHAFLVELKRQELQDFTDRLSKACCSLLHNQRLLNTFVVILFKKADINNSSSVLKLLDVLQLFFAAVNKKNRMIPTTFDYNYFLRGFKMILQSSHCYSLGKGLLILYNHFNIFSQQFKFAISMYLMGKLFFRLFLHWSHNVRTIFHHLIYIRINKLTQLSNKNNKGFSRHERAQIKSRYDKLMIILQNATDLKKKQDKPDQMRYQKDLYKKMKKRLYTKKNQSKRNISQTNDDETQISMKALSYNPRKNSTADQRIIQQLARPKLQRYNSQVMNKTLKIAIQEAKNKKDQIIPLRISTTQIYVNDLQAQRKDSSDNKDIKKISFLSEQQSQIWQMTKNQTQYLSRSLAQYGSIHELFLKHLSKNNNVDSVPVVKLQISYDHQDIRPQKIDDW